MLANRYPPPKNNEPPRFGLKTRLISMVLTVAMVFTFLPTAAFAADGDVAIDETNFPDSTFRYYVSSKLDTSRDGSLSQAEIDAVTSINLYRRGSDSKVTSLQGIEYFTALTNLDLYNNQLTELDLSKNTALKELDCAYNQLTELDVSNCAALEKLYCQHNSLTELNLGESKKLKELNCWDNQLTELDLSDYTELEELLFEDESALTTLNVSGCTSLKELDCEGSGLTSLNVTGCTALQVLSCSGSKLTALDVSGCTALVTLYCYKNNLTELNVNGCTALKTLYCWDNELTDLDVSSCVALKTLSCSNDNLTTLNVNGCTALEELSCSGTKLTAMDVSNCTALKDLTCVRNESLTELNVSGCTALEDLDCFESSLTSLDVSSCTALKTLYCWGNELTDLNVDGCIALETLSCGENNLTGLNVDFCTALKTLSCGDNDLTELDVDACIALEELNYYRNSLTSLDISSCTALTSLTGYENVYAAQSCDVVLSELPGSFDETKASNWKGGTVKSGVLILDPDSTDNKVTYTYSIGNSKTQSFTIDFSAIEHHEIDNGTCVVCGRVIYPEQVVHTAGTEWINDADNHWKTCGKHNDCGYTFDKASHTYQNGICTVCGAKQSTVQSNYTITVLGGKAYSDAAHQNVITSAKGGDIVYVEANNQSFEGWASEGDAYVEFDSAGNVSTFFTMPDGNVTVRAKGDAAPAPSKGDSGSSGSGAAVVMVGAGLVAIVGGTIAVMMMMPVAAGGHIVAAASKAVLPGATIKLMKDGEVVAEAVTAADGSFNVSAKSGEYDAVVTWTDESGNPQTGTAHVKINAFGNASGINVEV